MIPTIYRYDNSSDFAADAAASIEDFISWTLESKEVVRIALSGGKSPEAAYEALGKSDVDWDKVEIFMVDERNVSPNSDQSNFNMLERTILQRAPNIKGFYSFNTDLDPREAAEEYEATLKLQNAKPLFDLVILGMGEDGHTASLFPGIPELNEASKLVVNTTAKDEEIQERLTLTFPAILSSQKIMFLIQGKKKDKVVKKLLDGNALVREVPAQKIMEHENVEIYFNPN